MSGFCPKCSYPVRQMMGRAQRNKRSAPIERIYVCSRSYCVGRGKWADRLIKYQPQPSDLTTRVTL